MTAPIGIDSEGEWEGVRLQHKVGNGTPFDVLHNDMKVRPGDRLILSIGGQEWTFWPSRVWTTSEPPDGQRKEP